ncbi:amidohydrolase [Nocardioides islandensis]|uniref:Amidohydrolase n=1 Tax=Nocardioides islandensis TaxID=433663 RepID=A0A930VIP5_9ACTN|nr:amidohydrolase [Nocardioides islandensis]MBF4765578.1 amidohydrolase [Nocardioides islandensis]
MTTPAHDLIDAAVEAHRTELLELRRDLHANPELSWHEQRTTDAVATRLEAAGLSVRRLLQTGLVVDVGDEPPRVALRADLDALPVDDLTTDPWVSTRPGVAHACGHDVHTAGLVGAGLALAELHRAGLLPGGVRLLFQPAEEVMPGGATALLEQDVLVGVERIYCLHCDPTLDLGQIGVREGPITGAADQLEVRLTGSGGHTSRPHLTEDLTFALGKLITELPAVLSRRLDPRAGVSVVWGMVRAGVAPNVIPAAGVVGGTVRMLDAVAWSHAERLVREFIDDIVAPYGVKAEVDYRRGVPPVVNDHAATALLAGAVEHVVGVEGRVSTTQSLGGEDFAWFLDAIPGSMGRLGTRTPGGPTYDLHQGNLRVDEGAALVAARVLATVALDTLA